MAVDTDELRRLLEADSELWPKVGPVRELKQLQQRRIIRAAADELDALRAEVERQNYHLSIGYYCKRCGDLAIKREANA